jgi:hypothetical protein
MEGRRNYHNVNPGNLSARGRSQNGGIGSKQANEKKTSVAGAANQESVIAKIVAEAVHSSWIRDGLKKQWTRVVLYGGGLRLRGGIEAGEYENVGSESRK